MVLFFPNTLTNIDSILSNIIDLPNNNVQFQGDIYKTGPLRFYIDNTLVQTLDSTGITIDVPKNITDDFKITGNLVMSTESGGGKGRLFFTDTISNLTNYITYEPSNKIKIQVGDLNINSTNTNIVGNLTLPNSSIITSFINNGAVDGSKLSNTLDLSSKTITLPNNSITTSNITNGAVDGSKLSSTLDFSGKTISNITLPNLPQRINTRGYTFEFLRDGETLQTLAQHDALTDTEHVSIHNVFGGDVNVNSFWGISCNLQNGRMLTENATQSRDVSSFTINKKDSATTYERLLTCDLNGRVSSNALSINGGSTSTVCGIKGRTRIESLGATDTSAVLELKPSSGNTNFIYANSDDNILMNSSNGEYELWKYITSNTLYIRCDDGNQRFGGYLRSHISNDERLSIGVMNGTLDGVKLETQAMMIKTNGDVGIGLSNPTEKLHVKGNVKCNNIIADNITSGGGNVQYFDGEIIFKKVYKVSLLKSSIVGADGSTFYKLGLYNYQPIPNPSGFYSIVNCNLKYISDYITGTGTEGLTLQLRGIISNDYDPATDDGNYWLLDEECGYWNGSSSGSANGGGGRFSPSSTMSGGMEFPGGNNNFVFLFYGRRGTTTRSNVLNSFRDPDNVDTTLSNGWQVDTTYSGGPVSMDDDVVLHPFMKIEIEQIIYSSE